MERNLKNALYLAVMMALLVPGAARAAPSAGFGGGSVEADHISAMSEIDAAIKTDDADTKLVTTTLANPAGNLCLEIDSTGTVVHAADTCANLGPGGTTPWHTIGDTAGDGDVPMAEYDQDLSWNTAAAAAAFDGLTISLVYDGTSDVGEQNLMRVVQLDGGGDATGNPESLLLLENLDTTADDAVDAALEIRASNSMPIGIKATDPEIVAALAIGLNTITSTNCSMSDDGTNMDYTCPVSASSFLADASPSVDDDDTSLATTAFVQAETVAAGDVTGTIGTGLTIGAGVVEEAMMSTEDFGSFSCAGGADDCLIDSGAVTEAMMSTEDFGDFSCAGGADDCDLNANVVGTSQLDMTAAFQFSGAWDSTTAGTVDFAGPVTATGFVADDRTVEPGNRIQVNDNDTAFTSDPTCANSGTAGQLTILDVEEGAGDNWQICDGTSILHDIVNTAADIIADTQILVGTGAGTGAYVTMSSDATLANTGALTIADSVAVASWTLTTPTLSGISVFPFEATPTTDADGEFSIDLDAWAAGHDTIEFWDGTASVYVVATTASAAPSDGQVPKWNTDGTITWQNDADTGGATKINDLGDADAYGTVGMAMWDQGWNWDTGTTASTFTGLSLSLLFDATTDGNTQNLVKIVQKDGGGDATGQPETLLLIENLDTTVDDAVLAGLEIRADTTMPIAINLSDASIVTALALGENDITVSGVTVTATELEELAAIDATVIAAADWTQLALLDGGSPALSVASMTGSLDLGTGTIQGAVNLVIEAGAATDSPTASEMSGSFFIASYATGPMVYDLPTAVAGENACFYDEEGDGITLVPNASDLINLDGTPLDVIDTIDSPGVAGGAGTDPGSFICVLAIDATTWITVGRSGTWIDAGAE